MNTDLRKAIASDARLKEKKVQYNIAKQIASGMNYLHSLNPDVLVISLVLIIRWLIKRCGFDSMQI